MIRDRKFRIRGRMKKEERIRTFFYTFDELINYAIPRGFLIESIDELAGNHEGVELYENDIIKTPYNDTYDYAYYQIIFDRGSWWRKCIGLHHKEDGWKDITNGGFCEGYLYNMDHSMRKEELEKIGNIYDNPELDKRSGE